MSSWQPIDTAPRDGNYILACVDHPNFYAPCAIVWASYHPNAKGKEGWRTSHICGNKMDHVTHWMPLPPLPSAATGECA